MKYLVLLVLLSSSLHANTFVTQTAAYDFAEVIFNGTNVTEDQSISIPVITNTFNQFSGAPEDLFSFTIEWKIIYVATGQLESSSNGSFGGSPGGTYYLDAAGYGGNGGGGGDGSASPGEEIGFTSTVSDSKTFLASEAGVTYDPANLASILGTETFDLSWGEGELGTFSSTGAFDSLSFVIDAGSFVEVTYSVVPEPETYALFLGGISLGLVCLSRKSLKA